MFDPLVDGEIQLQLEKVKEPDRAHRRHIRSIRHKGHHRRALFGGPGSPAPGPDNRSGANQYPDVRQVSLIQINDAGRLRCMLAFDSQNRCSQALQVPNE
jgi:hypothetical protein